MKKKIKHDDYFKVLIDVTESNYRVTLLPSSLFEVSSCLMNTISLWYKVWSFDRTSVLSYMMDAWSKNLVFA